MADAYVQVATDGAGKQVDMSTVRTLAGDTIYRQRAELVGDPAAAILALGDKLDLHTALLRAILFALTNGDLTEDSFTNQ